VVHVGQVVVLVRQRRTEVMAHARPA
jgi:hypothetical protein